MKNENKWFISFFNIKNQYLFIALFLSFLAEKFWLKIHVFQITNLHTIIPGIATFNNADVNSRISFFYESIFLIAFVFIICMILSFVINKKNGKLYHLLIPWNILSAIGVAFIFFELINSNQPFSYNFLFSVFLTLLLFQIAKFKFRFRLLLNTSISFIWLSLLSFSICFFVREILQIFTKIQTFELYIFYPIIFISLLCITILLSNVTKWNFKTIFLASLPFFLLPLFTVISDELYLILNQRNIHILSPDKFYALIIIICILIVTYLFFRAQKSNKINLKNYFCYYIYPVTLLSIVIFTQYKPFIDQPKELFELANSANAIMRIFNFNEFPIIQNLSSHFLSDINFGLIYTFLNGYNGSVDFLIYNFLLNVILILISYFFLIRIFKNSFFVFLTILFLPFISIVLPARHAITLISIFIISSLYKNYSFKKLLLLGLWSAFLVSWKVEVGLPSFVASLFLTGLYIRFNFRKKILIDFIKVFGIIIGTGIVLAILCTLIWKIDIYGNFLQAINYLGVNQAHGHPDISYNYNRLYDYHYFIFPIISIFIFLFLLLKVRIKKTENFNFLPLALLFLIIYYFINAQRGLVRHSMIEGTEMFMSSFFYLIFALFIYYLTSQKKYAKYIFIILLIFLINNFKYPNSNGYLNNFEELNTVFKKPLQIEKFDTKINRVIGTEKFSIKTYQNFKQFMDKHFDNNATFIDFSNTPMLYFYTKRRVPSYFNQYMQNTVTEYLQLENIKYLKQLNIPITVFSHVPECWYDNTDEVPNTIRYNKIAAYIYKNYTPLTILNNKYIWLKKGINITIPDSLKIDSKFVKASNEYDLKQYPNVLGKSEKFSSDTVVYKTWLGNELSLNLSDITKNNRYDNYLLLEIKNRNKIKTEILIKYSNKKFELGSFKLTVVPSQNIEKYVIPLSSQYNWIKEDVDMITIFNSTENPINMKFEKILLFAKNNE